MNAVLDAEKMLSRLYTLLSTGKYIDDGFLSVRDFLSKR